jgi:hypothetical protein
MILMRSSMQLWRQPCRHAAVEPAQHLSAAPPLFLLLLRHWSSSNNSNSSGLQQQQRLELAATGEVWAEWL